jgi:peptide/nickel transport system substrate-binding protein
MHGAPAWPAGFTQAPYANADAPEGGRIVFGLVGTFDSLNPLIVKGVAPTQMRTYTLESLLTRGQDEPFTLYGLLAQGVETDEARSFVAFTINPAAKFSDGTPVTADDVLFSWQLLRDRARPNMRSYYAKVAKAEALSDKSVRFTFSDTSDRELPLILGLMPILARHATNPDTFEQTSFTAPLGSGPYRVTNVRPGASVTLTRNPDYWGKDLPINHGLWNFDEVRLDYYRDANAAFEAFKRGLYDVHVESEPLRWQTGYDFPAMREGRVRRDTVTPGWPRPVEALVFNTRREFFANKNVREALTLLYDFAWINRNYYYGLYTRSGGFFPGSELSAYRIAADDSERALLQNFPNAVRSDILEGSWRLADGDQSGRDREALRHALGLLAEAGYDLKEGVLRERKTNQPVSFEIMVTTREQERVALAIVRDFKRAGIEVRVRNVDAVQFDQRRLAYEFDMVQARWDQSLSPGNELSFYFGSKAAETQGTRNYMGIKTPAVDALINAMLAARERVDFIGAVRALDRVLMSGFYVLPLYNLPGQWIARSSKIGWPAKTSLAGALPETWWRIPDGAR